MQSPGDEARALAAHATDARRENLRARHSCAGYEHLGSGGRRGQLG
jgi:hypothetical protein